MAYTAGIFYLDLVSGSDTARTTFAPTAYANNGSGLVRVTKTAHGLVTGAVIDITGSGVAAYNAAWKITRIDADNFDLDTSVYTSNPATKGTVAPRGGSSWTDAWLTPTSGATAARVAAGDEIRIAKTNDPVSIGNATWTSLSKTITLATAQTATIDNCEVAWTAANSGAVSRVSGSNKQGTYHMQITTAAATVANTKYAYYTLPATLDLSAYQQITLWIKVNTATSTTDRWSIRLCSDTTGDVTVDTFAVPEQRNANIWLPVVITKTGGGNLGSSIASIALYTGSVSPGNSQVIRFDNISASKTNNLNLNTLIGQSSNAYTLTQPWNVIQSIDGTTVDIDIVNDTLPANSKGWYTEGTSPATVTTYALKQYDLPYGAVANSPINNIYTLNTIGTKAANVVWSGGWDTSNTTQNGMTFVNALSGYGNLFGSSATNTVFNSFYRIGFTRGYTFLRHTASLSTNRITNGDAEFFLNGMTQSLNTGDWNTTTGWFVNSSGQITLLGGYHYNYICYNTTGPVSIGNSQARYEAAGDNILAANGTGAGLIQIGQNGSLRNSITRYATQYGLYVTSSWTNIPIYNHISTNNTNVGVRIGGSNASITINGLTTSNNSQAVSIGNYAVVNVNNINYSEATLLLYESGITGPSGAKFTNVNGSATDNRYLYYVANALTQTSVRKSATGVAWQVNVTDFGVSENNPFSLKVAKIACTGNKQVTVKAWVKKSHATDIGAKLMVRKSQLPGMTADVTATKSADTNWEELTVSFTPTIAGVVEVEFLSYWQANTADESTYIDDMTITEAA